MRLVRGLLEEGTSRPLVAEQEEARRFLALLAAAAAAALVPLYEPSLPISHGNIAVRKPSNIGKRASLSQ